MAQNSKIEWTDHTFNPWLGCTNVSLGCDHCYAESWSKRSGLVKWGNSPRRRTSEAYWRAPLKWQGAAASFQALHGRRQRVFCASLADVFDNQVDAQWRLDLFSLIHATPALDWLLLTKRPQNVRKMLPKDWGEGGRTNVWLGILYHMIHATDHDEAPKIMNRAYRNAVNDREELNRLQSDLSDLWGQSGSGEKPKK